MNFPTVIKQGLEGGVLSLDMGLPNLNQAIGGLKQGLSIGLAAAPKTGKTTLADYAFVISPYLYCEKNNMLDKIKWLYFSYEVSRVKKEFKFAAYFMFHDYGISEVEYEGEKYEMCADYLMGRLLTKEQNEDKLTYVRVSEEHNELAKKIYLNRITVLFGVWDEKGRLVEEGLIKIITVRKTPVEMKAIVHDYARNNGELTDTEYIPNDLSKFVIVIADHIRKIKLEKGLAMKQNVDKWLDITTEDRDKLNYIYINIIHSNRALANPDRLRVAGEWIFPTGDDSKDTGNIAEESTIFMTLFNANDEKYSLDKHMGHELKDYPHYRSLHITESRDTFCPTHLFYNMYGHVNLFTPLI